MICPQCGSPTRVDKTARYDTHILRMRRCTQCPWRRGTIEVTTPMDYVRYTNNGEQLRHTLRANPNPYLDVTQSLTHPHSPGSFFQ